MITSVYSLNFVELPAVIEINQTRISQPTILLQDDKSLIWISRKNLIQWKINIPSIEYQLFNGETYYPLAKIPGVQYILDKNQLLLKISADAEAFQTQQYSVNKESEIALRPNSSGFYLNYDINIPPQNDKPIINGIFDLGLFGSNGVIDNSFAVKQEGILPQLANQSRKLVRLTNVWRLDFPEKMQTLYLGDTINQPGVWGTSVSYAGIKFGTNFNTQPRLITYPLPEISGKALLPSTVDLYIDNARAFQKNIAPGPFDINAIPVLNGAGEINLVTRDILGRQQVVSIPYYTSASLLKPNLTDFSFEAGFIRRNYAINSFNYATPFISGTVKKGLSQNITREIHSALSGKNQTLGLSHIYLWNKFSLINFSTAISHSNHTGLGSLLRFAIERNAKRYNIGLSTTYSTQHFQQLGQSQQTKQPKLQSSIFSGVFLKQKGSIGVSFISQVNYYSASSNLLSANYTLSNQKFGSLVLSALTNIGGEKTKGIFLTYSHQIDNYNTAMLNGNRQNSANQFGFQFNHSANQRYGLDYYISAIAGENGNTQAGISYDNQYLDVNAQLAYQNKKTSYTLNGSGSIIHMEKQWYFSQRVTNSFGIVQIPTFENVGIYLDNQLVSRTDKNGYAFIPDLRSFDDNQLSIEPTSLPMDADIHSSVLHAVPFYHNGVSMKFNISKQQSANLTLVDKKGRVIPAGAMIKINNSNQEFPVGYNGKAYLTNLQPKNTLVAEWQQQSCQATFNFIASNEVQPDLGEIVCK